MFISKKEYNKLRNENYELLTKVSALENQCRILENNCDGLIKQSRAQCSSECNIGEWCVDCKHYDCISLPNIAKEKRWLYDSWRESVWVTHEGQRVSYCKKHIHDICPEWEK